MERRLDYYPKKCFFAVVAVEGFLLFFPAFLHAGKLFEAVASARWTRFAKANPMSKYKKHSPYSRPQRQIA